MNLAKLNAADTGKLQHDIADADAAYADALAKAAQAQRRADAYTDAVALCDKRLNAAQASLSDRLFSAIRGDTY